MTTTSEADNRQRRGLVLVAVIALVLVVVLGVAGFAFSRGWIDGSGPSDAARAAHRIDTVMTTGVLDPPSGVNRQIALLCEHQPGEPGIDLILSPGPGTQLGPSIADLPLSSGWEGHAAPPGSIVVSHRFGDWTATVRYAPLPGAGDSWTARLRVGTDRDIDCARFSDELTSVLRKDQARLATNQATAGG